MDTVSVTPPIRRRARQPVPPPPRDCRVGAAACLLPILRDLGFDPAAICAEIGFEPAAFADPERLVPFADFARFVDHCRARTGRGDLGLLIAARAGTGMAGALGKLVRSAPDVKTALDNIVRFMHLNAPWGVAQVAKHDDLSTIDFALTLPGFAAATVAEDAALGILYNFMRALCGPDWRPAEVWLAHARGEDAAAYAAYFGARVRFDALRNAVLFATADLDRPVPDAIARDHAALVAHANAVARARPLTFADEIRRIIRSHLADPTLSADWAAALHGIDRRTLSRRLAREGTTFSELHSSVRYESARALLRESNAELTSIAAALGYSEQSAFTRAFRTWSGVTPDCFRQTAR